jgi:AcrR family transcriptional regulator
MARRRSYTSEVRARAARETRMAILEAARVLFAEQGYARTSVAAIADRAGVALNTIYTSVGGKPALIQALTEEGVDDEGAQEVLDRIARLADGREILRLTAR